MNQEIVRPALGQIATVGTFYDARTDSFLSRSLIKETSSSESVSRQVVRTTVIESCFQEGFFEKFKRLKISFDLGASILSSVVPLDGPGRCIFESSNDVPQLRAAIYHTVTTVQDKLELSSTELRSNVALSQLHTSDATHVLVEVQYGSQTVVVVNKWLRPDEQQAAVEPQFMTSIENFVTALQNQVPYLANEPADSFKQVRAFGSMLGGNDIAFDGLQDARRYLDLIPAEMRSVDGGEGTPIMYRLIPVKTLELFGLLRVEGVEVTTAASSESLKKFINLLDEYQLCHRSLHNHANHASKYKLYLDPNYLQEISRRRDDAIVAERNLKTDFGSILKEVRRGSREPDELWQLVQRNSQGDLAPQVLASFAQANQQKVSFIETVTGKGAKYFGHLSPDLKRAISHSTKQDAYVLFFGEAAMQEMTSWNANRDLFLNLLQQVGETAFMAVVDCDATGFPLEKAVVTTFENGEEAVQDLLEEQQYLSQHCFARYRPDSIETKDIQRPLDRRFVKIACPGRNCDHGIACDWRCSECDAPLEYGFSDQYIYCDCGRSMYNSYEFKCNQDHHGESYARYNPSELLASLNSLDQSNYLNILILGETGVGKSTFINAFVNYLYFKTLDEALQNDDLNWVIPCSFYTQAMDRSKPGSAIIETKIEVGRKRDDEHDSSAGASATRKTMVYPITIGSMTYRLIDTPGIGDTRGLEYDKENMADILSTVSGYDDLHGILILLRSNNARMTIHFAFCVKELLSHLHRDATNNVVFGFTNTRITNYMPGDTYRPLMTLLKERPDIGLDLASNSVYCFDSESFRYLAAAKNNVIMANKPEFESSWTKSREEAHRMLDYFADKKPHSVKSTTSLNGTRNLIKELTKPMADISQLIRLNIDIAEDEMKQFQDARLSGDQLRTRLHPEKTLMKQVPLDKPRTVCSNVDCIEHKDNGAGTMLTDYPNPCHSTCYLEHVDVDVLSPPGLLRCWAFSGNQDCQQCGHHWTLHLHILYELQNYQTTIKDLGIEEQLKAHASDLELKQAAIKNRRRLIEEYQQEHDAIRVAAAKFGLFMKLKSILPYNDATEAYLKMLIEAEQARVDAGAGAKNQGTLRALETDLQKHQQLVQVFEQSMQEGGSVKSIEQDEVNRIVRELYNLKHFGKNLEDLQTDIAYTHARTNRENPHRVKARHGARRPGQGNRLVRHVPMTVQVSGGAQGFRHDMIVHHHSNVRPVSSISTTRTGPPQNVPGASSQRMSQHLMNPQYVHSNAGMPGGFAGDITEIPYRTNIKTSSRNSVEPKKSGLLASIFGRSR